MMYKIILFIWLIFEFLISQTIIGPGLTRVNLFDYLNTNYKTSTTLGYNQARDVMYSIIDLEDDNTLKGMGNWWKDKSYSHRCGRCFGIVETG